MSHKRAVAHPTIRDAIDYQDVTDAEPGDLEPGHIGIYNRRGERVGHVHGHKAGASVARRMLNGAPAVLVQLHGKPAWIQRQDPTAVAAKHAPDLKHAKDLAAAKGSATATPSAPRAHARPHR